MIKNENTRGVPLLVAANKQGKKLTKNKISVNLIRAKILQVNR